MRNIVTILSAVLILSTAACTAAATPPMASPTAPPLITITSPAFEPGAEIPPNIPAMAKTAPRPSNGPPHRKERSPLP